MAAFLTLPAHPGVFVDALLCDHDGRLLFVSLWARDVPILELLARIQLGETADGEAQPDPSLEFSGADGEPIIASVVDPDRLQRHQGRTPQACVFGSLAHTWIYDRLLIKPDLARQRALLLCHPEVDPLTRERQLWELILRTCRTPLLRSWRDPVLAAFREHGWITPIDGVGIEALAVDLAAPEAVIGDLVRSGRLTADEPAAGEIRG
jgi:hypothetical protein